MEINIKVLNVEDADSIIVTLEKEGKSFIILIDGGRAQHFEHVRDEIERTFATFKKDIIDLVICTHYDEDHIQGLLSLFDTSFKIERLWSFDIKQLLSVLKKETDESGHMFPSEKDVSIGSYENPSEKEAFDSLITSVIQEKQLIEKAIKRDLIPMEPIAGKVSITGWEEIEVLGPTQEYYNKLFPKVFDNDAIKEEVTIMSGEVDKEEIHENPCEEFSLKKSPISKVNLNSAVVLITVNEKKYLFSADAGIDSFEEIPNYKERLSNIYWLKAPHHGSKNNLNSSLIDLMQPKVVAISGDKYISNNLIKCMERYKCKIYNTRDHGHLQFRNGIYQEG